VISAVGHKTSVHHAIRRVLRWTSFGFGSQTWCAQQCSETHVSACQAPRFAHHRNIRKRDAKKWIALAVNCNPGNGTSIHHSTAACITGTMWVQKWWEGSQTPKPRKVYSTETLKDARFLSPSNWKRIFAPRTSGAPEFWPKTEFVSTEPCGRFTSIRRGPILTPARRISSQRSH